MVFSLKMWRKGEKYNKKPLDEFIHFEIRMVRLKRLMVPHFTPATSQGSPRAAPYQAVGDPPSLPLLRPSSPGKG